MSKPGARRLTLDRILQSQGFGTRKACRGLVEMGAVSVHGEIVDDWDATFDLADLEFEVDGEPWAYRAKVYVALHKPPGYECSRKPSHHPPVLSLLPEQFLWRDVQPVGRLDQETTGLLLLSDDGGFIHALSSPKRHVPKTYEATTHAPATDEQIARLVEGVRLIDEPAPLRAEVRRLGESCLEMVLDQGKYHQVRRMIAAAGNHCVALRRTAVGALTLESLGLAEGEWRFIEPGALGYNAPFPQQ